MGSEHLKRTLAKVPVVSISPVSEDESARKMSEKDRQIENHFMKELNLLNIDRIVKAL